VQRKQRSRRATFSDAKGYSTKLATGRPNTTGPKTAGRRASIDGRPFGIPVFVFALTEGENKNKQ
jgi:hypothetical protein